MDWTQAAELGVSGVHMLRMQICRHVLGTFAIHRPVFASTHPSDNSDATAATYKAMSWIPRPVKVTLFIDHT